MKNRKITLKQELERIIKSCDVCHLGMADNNGVPYVLPFNFGYHEGVIYLHSGPTGKKFGILEQNNYVCVAFSTDHELYSQSEKVACSYSMKYKSVLAFGKVGFIDDYDVKIESLNHIMANYTDREFGYNKPAVEGVRVFKIIIDKMEGRAFGY